MRIKRRKRHVASPLESACVGPPTKLWIEASQAFASARSYLSHNSLSLSSPSVLSSLFFSFATPPWLLFLFFSSLARLCTRFRVSVCMEIRVHSRKHPRLFCDPSVHPSFSLFFFTRYPLSLYLVRRELRVYATFSRNRYISFLKSREYIYRTLLIVPHRNIVPDLFRIVL